MSARPPTPYAVIGARRSDSQAQLKAAYRKVASRLHPDKNPTRLAQATQEMAILNAAWEQVKTPSLRAQVDAALDHEDAERRAAARRRREREAAARRRRDRSAAARPARAKAAVRSSQTIAQQGGYSSVTTTGSTSTRTRSPSSAERREAEAAAQGRTHRGDLIIDRRRHLTFAGTVTGSVTVGPGCSLDLTGAILGDLVVDGGGEGAQVRVLGTVGGALRASSGDIEVVGSTSGMTISSSSSIQYG